MTIIVKDFEPTELENIEFEREQLQSRLSRYLASKGWRYTSSTPGSLWLYVRKIGDTTYCVNEATAIHIQNYLDFCDR